MPVHKVYGIVRVSAGVHETIGKIDSVTGVDRTSSPHPTFFAFLSPQFSVAIALTKVTHTAGSGYRVDNSSGNYGLCVGRFFRSSCNKDIGET